jgi:ketosteroid isomerase-like protein
MTNAWESDMTDQELIRRVLAEFIQLRDDKNFAEWVELFTEDATFEYGSHHLVGRSAIRENVEALLRNDRGKHLCVNSIIDISGDTASVSSDFLKVNPSNDGSGTASYGIGTMGRYEDHFVRRADGWKIARRKVHIMAGLEGG